MKLTDNIAKWAKAKLGANDKVVHMFFSATITTVLFCLAQYFGAGLFMSVALAYLGLNLIGVAKEIHDHFKGTSGFDLDDIVANNIGSLAVLLVLVVLA